VDVPVAAQAVATYRSAACNVTPLFIVIRFEGELGADSLQVRLLSGPLAWSVLSGFWPRGNGTAFPGNFGSSEQALRNGVATLRGYILRLVATATCYDSGLSRRKPADRRLSERGQLRFDMYDGPMEQAS